MRQRRRAPHAGVPGLREHSKVARDYADLKRCVAPRYDASDPSAREAYAEAKTAFVERIVAAALADGYPRDL